MTSYQRTDVGRAARHRVSGRGGVTCRYHGHKGCKICAQLPPEGKQ